MKFNKLLLMLMITAALPACNNTTDDFRTYMKYLSDKDNGVVAEKSVKGLKMKVKYLPTDYLVYKEINNEDPAVRLDIDSIRASYRNSLTFLLTLGPEKEGEVDITRAGIDNYEDYADRIQQMHFDMKRRLSLRIGEERLHPELVQMESIYGLKTERNFVVVFRSAVEAGKKVIEDDFQFIYEDEMFLTGINKFSFEADDINSIPRFKF